MSTNQEQNVYNVTPMVTQPVQPLFVQVMPAPVSYFGPVLQQPLADLTPSPLPVLPTLGPSYKLSQVTFDVTPEMNVMFFDGMFMSAIPQNLTPTLTQGTLTAPEGYSFVTIDFSAPLLGEQEASVGNVETIADSSPEATPEPVSKPSQPKVRKFRHGSKQEKIMEVYEAIQAKYTLQGVYAGEHEVLRGADTIRVHVKTFKGLNQIEAALQEVDDCPDVRLIKLATPFSMKNRYQKKGFIVYMRVEHESMVDSVKAVFKKYEEVFRKCDVAMPKPTDPTPTEPLASKMSDFLPVDEESKEMPAFIPLPMVEQCSAATDAA